MGPDIRLCAGPGQRGWVSKTPEEDEDEEDEEALVLSSERM